MTNKEAKEKLYLEWQKFLENNIDYAGISEAYKKAFKALEQEPCGDAISRKNTLKAMIKQLGIRNEDYLLPAEATLYNVVKNMPPVIPQPKIGYWIYEKRKRLIRETDEGAEYITDYWCKCSKCGGDFGYTKMKDAFCKYCGARMIEPQESEG